MQRNKKLSCYFGKGVIGLRIFWQFSCRAKGCGGVYEIIDKLEMMSGKSFDLGNCTIDRELKADLIIEDRIK